MKKSYIIALAVVAIAIAAIMSTVSDSSTYASFAIADEHPNKEFHVVGKLNKEKPQDYHPEVNANLFAFYMTDNEGKECKVLLNKTKPQDFDRSEQIVIIGKMAGEEFHASDVLMKCPSKYNNPKEDIKATTNGN
ncbi:MAG: cytochrome c maturation protein CcmE [Bacteroidetes bacterium]|nr:cytochrome c maturation protein CcmE [Bacteroidota bacterium]